jgi:hypothetical protein
VLQVRFVVEFSWLINSKMGNKINVALEDPTNEAKVKEVFNSLDKVLK